MQKVNSLSWNLTRTMRLTLHIIMLMTVSEQLNFTQMTVALAAQVPLTGCRKNEGTTVHLPGSPTPDFFLKDFYQCMTKLSAVLLLGCDAIIVI